ncbi:MAG: DUF4209 domain-containing protein [Planctomycetota bacterium]
MNTPDEVAKVIAAYDARAGSFNIHELHGAILREVDVGSLPNEHRARYWAAIEAFGFSTHRTPHDGPWKSYFQPRMTFKGVDGTLGCNPDINQATADTIAYWATCAREAKHPVLAARYADLVWDFSKRVTGEAPDIEFARLAIDSYIAALKKDDGEAWGDNRKNVERVLHLAQSVGDGKRVVRAANSIIDYSDRTSEDGKLGTYCYLFELLILPKKTPPLEPDQREAIITRFETLFAKMTTPGAYDAAPRLPQTIGLLLAEYYNREGRDDDRRQTLVEVAKAHERRAGIGDAMAGMHFLNAARQFYTEAGVKGEAERVLRAAQELAPNVKREMTTHTVEFDISKDEKQEILDRIMTNGVEEGLLRWTAQFLPRQKAIRQQKEELDEQFVSRRLFPPTVMDDEGIIAEVSDTQGDPDGPMIYETSRYMQLYTVFMSWCLDHLIQNGLTSEKFVGFVAESPVFEESRLPLIRRGIEAHINGDYTQAIHLAIPQIERALVELIHKVGGSSKKPHRSGRGVMQSKSLNDALADEPTRKALGEDLTIYLAATLSHPKGMNIRNLVCHGIMPPEHFTKTHSERVLHTLAALSLLRAKGTQDTERED